MCQNRGTKQQAVGSFGFISNLPERGTLARHSHRVLRVCVKIGGKHAESPNRSFGLPFHTGVTLTKHRSIDLASDRAREPNQKCPSEPAPIEGGRAASERPAIVGLPPCKSNSFWKTGDPLLRFHLNLQGSNRNRHEHPHPECMQGGGPPSKEALPIVVKHIMCRAQRFLQ